MACNGKEDCLHYYKELYPTLVSEIDSAMTSASKDLSDVATELGSLKVPDDYLGEKVRSQLESLYNNFSSDASRVKVEKNAIDSHVSGCIKTHREHYRVYLAKLEAEALLRAKEETGKDI